MTTIIPPSLNFKTVEKASPSYTYVKIPINSIPGGAFALSFTTQTLIDFKLPNKVVNLGRSYLGYVNSFAQDKVGTTIWVPEDTTDLGIANCSLMSSLGFDAMNLNYTTNYLKIGAKLGTSREDILKNGVFGDGLYLGNQSAGTVSNYYPMPYDITVPNPWGYPAIAILGAASTEIQYLSTSSLPAGTLGQTLVKLRQFPLSFFKDTILALDKDIYFGHEADMFLRMMVGGNKVGFTSSSQVDPTLTAAALFQASSAISDMYLYLAVENNPEVINTIMETYNLNKLVVQIPYTVGVKTNTPSSTVNNVTVNITKNYGKYLKKITHTLYNGAEEKNTNFDMSNWNGSKCRTYNTLLDTVQLQPQLVSCVQPIAGAVNSNDYAINKRIVKSSALVGLGQYQNNWFHCDTFYDDVENDDTGNIREGLLMTDNHIWNFASTTTAAVALNNYTFMTFSRDLMISPQGLMYV